MTKKHLKHGRKNINNFMDLMFKNWFEDVGEVLTTYNNVDDENFNRKGINSVRTGGRKRPEKSTFDPDKLFKFKKKLKK